jgi:predicted phage terminase large subunit-like protein
MDPLMEELEEFLSDDVAEGTSVVDYLNNISYEVPADYVPSTFALEFINFIKMVNGPRGEENKTPVMHMWMLDQVVDREPGKNIVNLCFRGSAKTTVLAEYLFLFIAVYGKLPGFGKVPYALYVSDSIDNGVKKMRLRLERRVENSTFLREFLNTDATKFTDIRWYFKNKEGNEFVVTGHGAKTGVRGTVELNTRPVLAVLDDLISDEDARSDTVIASVEDVVYKAIDYALHPTNKLIIWSGTPFNARDPLYKAVESGAWTVNVYPVCEQFPCTREEFRGAWSDRFTYDYVLNQYRQAKKIGKIDTFNQELMLRIMSEEDRLVQDDEIGWYHLSTVTNNRQAYNFYITTDFATSDKQAADFSVISVWALNSNGDWFWVDGICRRQTMDKNIDDLFRLVQKWGPQSVGIEVSGQQQGFIQWIQSEQANRNIWFTLASDKNSGAPGIRPVTNKMQRFNLVVPWFKARKIFFPEELQHSQPITEAINELTLISPSGFKSKKDDFADTISMLGAMTVWKPSELPPDSNPAEDDIYGDLQRPNEPSALESYLV